MRRMIVPLLFAFALVACSKESPGPAPAASSSPAQVSPAVHHEHQDPAAADPRAHQDHGARHAGMVTMEGDAHVEIVVSADGLIDLYVSDAVRGPVSAKEVSGTITVDPGGGKEKQTLPLIEDSAKGSLSAKGPPPAGSADYTWKLTVRGNPLSMTMPVPAGGTAAMAMPPSDHAQAGDHAHGSPHGGIVQTLGDGHVEVKLEKSGDVTVWMLDGSEKPRSAKGVVATLRLVAAGSKEVSLSYDDKSDTLRGKVDPVSQEHLDAVLSVTPPGGAAASARFKFHLEAHHGGAEGHHEGH